MGAIDLMVQFHDCGFQHIFHIGGSTEILPQVEFAYFCTMTCTHKESNLMELGLQKGFTLGCSLSNVCYVKIFLCILSQNLHAVSEMFSIWPLLKICFALIKEQ